jgi:hypothetical protein
VDAALGALDNLIAPHLTEQQRRLQAAAAARALGPRRRRTARISGCPTRRCPPACTNWTTRPTRTGAPPGGGPKRLTERQPGLLSTLDALVDPDTPGDPQVAVALDLQVHPGALPTRLARRISGL